MTDHFPEEDLTEQLLDVIQHSNPNVRAGAAIALGRLGSFKSVEPLIEMLGDPVYRVQRSAVRAIGMIGAPAVGVILAVLQENTDAVIDTRLADALGYIRDPAAVEILAASVNYLSPPSQFGAIEALGKINDSRAVPALVQVNRSDNMTARLKSAQSLLEIGAPEAALAMSGLLDVRDTRVLVQAIDGLGKIGNEQSVLSLLTLLGEEDVTVRQAAAQALMGVQDPIVLDSLLTTLNNSSAWVQQTIAEVLGNFPKERVADRLIALLSEHGDLGIRLTAAQSLSISGDQRGEALILRTLNAPNVETRRSAAIALGKTGNPLAVEPFIETIRKKPIDPGTPKGRYLRRSMIASMVAIGAPVIGPFIELLADESSFVSRVARDVLLGLENESVEQLIRALRKHRKIQVRIEAARLLGEIGDPQAVEPLSDALRAVLIGPFPIIFISRLFFDPSANLRAAAAEALGRIEGDEGTTLLISTARFDPDLAVNEAAEAALARKGSPAGILRLAQADLTGFINHGLASASVMLLLGLVTAGISRIWGLSEAALLSGLAAGAVYGYVDALQGRKRSSQGAIIGGFTAVLAAWLLAEIREPWVISTAGFVFPAIGAFLGWNRAETIQRIAGLFGGMVLGFLGAGIMMLILGTIR